MIALETHNLEMAFTVKETQKCQPTSSCSPPSPPKKQFSKLVHVVAKQDHGIYTENTKVTQKKRQALKSLLKITLGLLIDFTIPDL